MRPWLRRSWPILKAIFTIAILFAIGRRFAIDLQIPEKGLKPALEEFWQGLVHPGWLVASGIFYIAGLGFSALYWCRLLHELGQRPAWLAAVRAYYVGHAGKYLPGKAWAVFLRAGLIRGPNVRFPRAVLTTFYEVLVTMAGGVVLAIVLVALLAPDTAAAMDWPALWRLITAQETGGVADRKVLLALGILLLLPIGIPILPPIYNWIIARMATRIRQRYGITGPLPRVSFLSMIEGLVITALGWILLGASLWAVLQAIMLNPPPLTAATIARHSAFLALAYVAGFIIFLVPSGLGIREFFLTLFLLPELGQLVASGENEAKITAVFAVITLRVVWTASELVVLPAFYLLPASLTGAATNGSEQTESLVTDDSSAARQSPATKSQGLKE